MLLNHLSKFHIQTLDAPIDIEQIKLLNQSLENEINEKQSGIYDLYQEKSARIEVADDKSASLISRFEQLQDKRKELQLQIDECSRIESQAKNVNSNYHQIHRLDRFIDGIKRLIELENVILDCGQLLKKGNLCAAKVLFQSIGSIIHDSYLFPANDNYKQYYPLYEKLKRAIRQLEISISKLHTTLWNDAIIFDDIKITLSLHHLDNLFQCTFDTDSECSIIEKQIKSFAVLCQTSLFQNNDKQYYKVNVERLNENDQTFILIKINQKEEEGEEEEELQQQNEIKRFTYVISQLHVLFDTLSMYLLSRQINWKSPTTVMSIYSKEIKNDFIDSIRQKLLNLIPNNTENIDLFKNLLNVLAEFEEYLKKIHFFDTHDTNVFLSVVNNLDESIIKSKCRLYLQQARDLLLTHQNYDNKLNTMTYGDDKQVYDMNELDKQQRKTDMNYCLSSFNMDEIDSNMFRFPKSIIIEHVYEYVNLIKTVLIEAQSLDQYASHLCATARNIMELFHTIYSNIHIQKALEFPYLTAIQFNTYMYVAHECLLLGQQFQGLKSKTSDGHFTFVDYVPLLRNQAANILKQQIDTQKHTLTKFIKDVGGHICDHVSLQLINHTLILEDIAEQDSKTLLSSFTQWAQFLQDILVKDEHSPGLNILERLSPNITRFNELCLVLNSPLQTIVDRWFNGTGPLASYFGPLEVKQLIRALFQNTERRTAALAKIT
ncbi:unnamed protein product [Didymodactylos carnosus]|uniref:Uncharacterized protein n=1 Tax=Didymodactylos carnosus TaxID=1234261 RepID=A0A813RVR1_9BILA|nr:unnamed protein product [Didymodactylos carnosus]CAF0787503.1 unnamed protein product [Didymodactylos carnosus]CAF3523340.1 unnamed protein product [Didymodactylos carnosus]CAF3571511.1 unnamed protein product [Didymodactylos carnosus]